MGGVADGTAIVPHAQVRVVILLVGDPRDGIDEGHGVVEIGETKLATDGSAIGGELPLRYLRQQFGCRRRRQRCVAALLRQALLFA